MNYRIIIKLVKLIVILTILQSCINDGNEANSEKIVVHGPYKVIRLPLEKGVNVLNPIIMALSPEGKIFAANQSGEIYTLVDTDGDGLEDSGQLYCNISDYGLRSASGIVFRSDTMYVSTSQEIRAFIDKNGNGIADTSWTFFNDIPYSAHPYEWTSGLTIGPDGWFYCALTTDSWNAGASPDPKKVRGAIIRISPDGKQSERLATGIRSVYGMDFNQNGDLFFADNAGGGNVYEELNILVKDGFYGHNTLKYTNYDSILGPGHKFETEVAPAQIVFVKEDNHFGDVGKDLYVAFYGPSERWTRGAVARVKINKHRDGNYEFEEIPIADIPKLSGITFGRDGSLYVAHHGVSDYWYNSIKDRTGGFYKIVFDPTLVNKKFPSRNQKQEALSANSIEAGSFLFKQQACFACHATDDSQELLGPNLNGISKRLSRQEIFEEIENPSKIIKPSMVALRVTKKNGQVLLGRMLNTDEHQLSLMIIGNSIIHIPRSEIAKTEDDMKSLMYENLLSELSQQEKEQLLDYIMSL